MKNKLSIIILSIIIFAVFPFILKADTTTYNTLNFQDTLKAEEIEEEFTNYKESDDQITIYMFRGQGCSFCRAYLNFMNSITEEYGKCTKCRKIHFNRGYSLK